MCSYCAALEPETFSEIEYEPWPEAWEPAEAEEYPDWLADDMEEPDDIVAINGYEWLTPQAQPMPWHQNGFLLLLVAVLIMAFVAVITQQSASASSRFGGTSPADSGGFSDVTFLVSNPTAVGSLYDEYTITQGIHGRAYGHMAVDLAAGRGTPVKSPINGVVTNTYLDEYANTTLVLENDLYVVTILHIDIEVEVGQELRLGEVIGRESNNGYTMDMRGNLCFGRTHCGNHTHINIYDKRQQTNVNPLELIR